MKTSAMVLFGLLCTLGLASSCSESGTRAIHGSPSEFPWAHLKEKGVYVWNKTGDVISGFSIKGDLNKNASSVFFFEKESIGIGEHILVSDFSDPFINTCSLTVSFVTEGNRVSHPVIVFDGRGEAIPFSGSTMYLITVTKSTITAASITAIQ
jgi:hypothetical protein